MDTKIEKNKWHILLDQCRNTIVSNLTFHWVLHVEVSPFGTTTIFNEFRELKKMNPNSEQMNILSALSEDEVKDMGKKLAGVLTPGAKLWSAVDNCTGQTAVYWNDFTCYKNHRGLAIEENELLPKIMLRDRSIKRQKAFILSFSNELLKYADAKQICSILAADEVESNILPFLALERDAAVVDDVVTSSQSLFKDYDFFDIGANLSRFLPKDNDLTIRRHGLTASYKLFLNNCISLSIQAESIGIDLLIWLSEHIQSQIDDGFVMVGAEEKKEVSTCVLNKDTAKTFLEVTGVRDVVVLAQTCKFFARPRLEKQEQLHKEAEERIKLWG